jgi:phosphohistidine phosphatase
MKQLHILRHAKSSWNDPSLRDFDRPLNDRGRKAAPFMGEWMAANGIKPNVIVSSPAERARQTATLAKEAAGFDCPLRFDERIYDATLVDLVAVVSELSEDHGSALIVGHNPGMEALVRYLTGETVEMPTAALASMTLDIEAWKDVEKASGDLDRLVRSKAEMKAAGVGKPD